MSKLTSTTPEAKSHEVQKSRLLKGWIKTEKSVMGMGFSEALGKVCVYEKNKESMQSHQ